MSNSRPVSLTRIVGKLLSYVIAKNIREHLEKFSLINDSQHEFSKGRSCLTNLLSFYRKIYEALYNDENYDITYLDSSKAFDKVPHDRLRSKFTAHGIDGKVLHWISSWLSNRQRRVPINGSKSECGGVGKGNKWSATGICFGAITILNSHISST